MSGEISMTDKLRRQMMEDLQEYGSPPQIDEDEFTIAQFAEYWKMTYDRARKRLEKALVDGRVTVREVRTPDTGRKGLAYRVATPKAKSYLPDYIGR